MARDRAASLFYWTEVEEQADRNYLPFRTVVLIPDRFLPLFHLPEGSLTAKQSEGEEVLENSQIRILGSSLETPGGEPLREFQILFKSNSYQAIRLELLFDGRSFLETDLPSPP